MCKVVGIILSFIVLSIGADGGVGADALFLGMCVLLAGFMAGDD